MDFLQDFEDRTKEVERYFEFIFFIEKLGLIRNVTESKVEKLIHNNRTIYPLKKSINLNGDFIIDIELNKTLKASTFLILYNLVEGSITAALNAYFESFSVKNSEYKKLTREIKRVWLEYRHKAFKNKNSKDLVQLIETLLEEKVSITPKTVNGDVGTKIINNYDAYNAEIGKSDISGNLDARKIRDLAEMYGFKLPKNNSCDSLVTIKQNRNKLAHGESSFSEVGKLSIEDLYEIKQETVKYIRKILKSINRSIIRGVYLQK